MTKKHTYPGKGHDKSKAKTHAKKEHSGTINYIRNHKVCSGLLAVLLFSFGGPLNFFGSNPNILYLPAIISCVCILYFTHEYVTSLKSARGNSPIGAQTTEPVPPSEGPRLTVAKPTPETSRFTVIRDQYEIEVGSNRNLYSADFLREKGIVIPLSINRRGLITAQLEHDRLRVDAQLFDASIRLVGNTLTGLPARWDANFDDSAFEIVSDSGIPMFQLEYRTDEFVKVRGIFASEGAVLLVDEKGIRSIRPTWDAISANGLTPLFIYPSKEHKGERR